MQKKYKFSVGVDVLLKTITDKKIMVSPGCISYLGYADLIFSLWHFGYREYFLKKEDVHCTFLGQRYQIQISSKKEVLQPVTVGLCRE